MGARKGKRVERKELDEGANAFERRSNRRHFDVLGRKCAHSRLWSPLVLSVWRGVLQDNAE